MNQAPEVQAFTPSIALNADGQSQLHYGFRKDTPDSGALLTCLWRSGVRVPFLGDYQGLAAVHGEFLAFFAATNSGDALTSSVFATSTIHSGDTFPNGRVEMIERRSC